MEKQYKQVLDTVRQAYGDVARRNSGCCGSTGCCSPSPSDAAVAMPEADLGLSCGDPVIFSRLASGDVVLDLGSGAGRDVFTAAREVGAGGRVIGVDMTPEMLALARRNAETFSRTTGLTNVEFREGRIEELPLESAMVDVVISNCVINLSPDKPAVFREVYRVLKPGGRMVISDIVLNRPLPDEARQDGELYSACIAGALLREEYLAAIRGAGFGEPEILKERVYRFVGGSDPLTSRWGSRLEGVASSLTLSVKK